MAAAFLMDKGRRRTSAEFMREIEEEGIKFSIENTAEDIINGLFCTYEPPTSKIQQYKAANAVRKNPTKFNVRPSVPKSILKFKVKKNKKEQTPTASVAPSNDDAKDSATASEKKSVTWRDQKGRPDRTEMENKMASLASKFCGVKNGEGIADFFSSPTGRAAQSFFATDAESPRSMASMASSMYTENTEKKVLYDDEGNPIREDDVQDDENGSYFPSTPKAAAPTPMNSSEKSSKKGGHSNLFCSNIPFMDTMVEGIGIAGVMAASAAVAAGVPENLCSPYVKPTADDASVYEPESYDQLTPAAKFTRQSTPRYMPNRGAENEDQETVTKEATPTPRSCAASDITMGNTTVNHFSENTSVVNETTSVGTPRNKFNSMMAELKTVQLNKGLEGSSQHDNETKSVGSIKDKFVKSPRSPVVTRTYLDSIKSQRSPGKVSDIAKQFESPHAVRKPMEPAECREFTGMMNFLPPTPRRQSPGTPVNSSTPVNRSPFRAPVVETPTVSVKKNIAMFEKNKSIPTAAPSVNTDAEIREAASSVVDVTAQRGGGATDEQRQGADTTKKSKKSKKAFFKKVMNPVRKITKKVESQRIDC